MRISGSCSFVYRSLITKACVEYAPPVIETKAVRQIDFNAVGEATNLKPPAARMRYTRLRRQIEGRTLIGSHGTSFFGVAERTVDTRQKRKKSWKDEDNMERPLRTLHIKAESAKVKAEEEHAPGNFEMPNGSDSEDDKPLAKIRYGINVRPNSESYSDFTCVSGQFIAADVSSRTASPNDVRNSRKRCSTSSWAMVGSGGKASSISKSPSTTESTI
jgi:hypothetical protein